MIMTIARSRRAFATLLMILCTAATAQAAPGLGPSRKAALQRTMARLRGEPGAHPISPNEIEFDDGVRVAFVESAWIPGTIINTCRRGKFCAYSDANNLGIRAEFPPCTKNHPKSYQLDKYGLKWNTPFGVTSWRNLMPRGNYSAMFLKPFSPVGNFGVEPLYQVNKPGIGHMPPHKNNQAIEVDMLCVRG